MRHTCPCPRETNNTPIIPYAPEQVRNWRVMGARVVAMASQIAVNVSLSSFEWSVTRERGDKLVMIINVVERGERKKHPFSV